jgi:hypothetical protein
MSEAAATRGATDVDEHAPATMARRRTVAWKAGRSGRSVVI